MVVSVDKATLKDDQLTLTLSNPAEHGLLDGGHTYSVLRRDAPTLEHDQFVRIELIRGFGKREIAQVIQARNTSASVKAQSLLNYQGVFEPIKKALAGEHYADLIAYKEVELDAEGRPKPISVLAVVQVLVALDAIHFEGVERDDAPSHPMMTYRSTSETLKFYAKNYRSFAPIVGMLPDFLRLHDHVALLAADETAVRRLKGVKKYTKPFPTLPFMTDSKGEAVPIQARVPAGYLFPALSAFRALLKERKGTWVWEDDPTEALLSGPGRRLIDEVVRQGQESKSPALAGKASLFWDKCFQIVAGTAPVRGRDGHKGTQRVPGGVA